MIDSHRHSHRAEQSAQPAFPAERASSAAARATTLSVAVRRQLPGFTLDIAFDAPRGLTVLFGPSGAGKSLTLQAIAGLFPLDSASIALEGLVWHDSKRGFYLTPQRRHVGYVPQHYALFPHLTVEQNIAFGLKGRGKQSTQRVDELIELMQLGGLEGRRPAQLSGGQQQRVALARALAPDPLLLLLDEPFSSLDAAVRETLREEMRALHERVHVPIVLVTHDAAEARVLADTVVVIQQGRVLQVGTPDEVFRSPRTRAIAALVGMHTCWRGKVITVADGIATVSIDAEQDASAPVGMPLEGIRVGHRGQARHDLTLQARIPTSIPVHPGQTLELGIRTDEVRVFAIDAGQQLAASFDGQAAPTTLVRGTVLRDHPKGAFHSITILLETGHTLEIPMIAREVHDLGIATGSPLLVGIPLQAVHIFED